MSARCWIGGPAERPSNEAKILNMTRQASADGGTTLVGQLPDRGENFWSLDYSCNYGFIQKYDKGTYFVDIPIPDQQILFNEGEQVEIQYPVPGGAAALDEKGYYVAGSNQIPPFNSVEVASGSFTGTVPDNFDFEEHQAATANPSNPFKHFPKGTAGSSAGRRHPSVLCKINGPCPNPTN